MLTDKNKDTFCPAHWNDIHFAPSQGYMYGCCKSVPISMDNMDELEKRKQNSLNGIRDPGCDYCWKTEDAGKKSLRNYKLKWFDGTENCRLLTLVLGNLCNLQCTYCNEKYSSNWQSDKKRFGEIEMQFDSEVYYGGQTCVNRVAQDYIDFYNKTMPTHTLTVSGGEPLMGNIFCDILTECDLSSIELIRVSTNLNFPNWNVMNKLLEFQDSHRIILNASLDTIDSNIQEYTRYGFSWEMFKSNLDHILDKTTVRINFNTLATAHAVFGIYDMYEFVYNLKSKYPDRINWSISTCVVPAIHTFDILTDEEKAIALVNAQKVQVEVTKVQDQLSKFNKVDVDLIGINKVISSLQDSTYNEELRKDQQNFFKQFNERQGIQTPNELKYLVGE